MRFTEVEELNNKAYDLAKDGKYLDAIQLLNSAKEINHNKSEQIIEPKSEDNNQALNYLTVFYKVSYAPSALTISDIPLEIENKKLNDYLKLRDNAILESNKGSIYSKKKEEYDPSIIFYTNSIEEYYKVLDIVKSLKEDDLKKQRIIQTNEEISSILNDLAIVYMKKGHLTTAINCLNQSIDLNNNCVEAINNKGICLAKQKKYTEAIGCFDKVKLLNSKFYPAITNRAWVKALCSLRLEAYDDITESLRIKNDDSLSLYVKGFILHLKGENDEAIKAFDASLIFKRDLKYSHYQKGHIYMEKGDYEKADDCYDSAISLDPSFAEAYNGKAVVLSHKKDLTNAIINIKKSIEIKPSLSTAHENLSKLVMNLNFTQNDNFWDFWGKTRNRKLFAIGIMISSIILLSMGMGVISNPFLINTNNPNVNPSEIIHKNITTVNESGNKVNTIIEQTNSTKNSNSRNEIVHDISQSYLIVFGLLILVILFPQIKSAKAGPIELETTTVIVSSEPSLKISEDEYLIDNDFTFRS